MKIKQQKKQKRPDRTLSLIHIELEVKGEDGKELTGAAVCQLRVSGAAEIEGPDLQTITIIRRRGRGRKVGPQ